MNKITKTILLTLIPIILGLCGKYVDNKIKTLSDVVATDKKLIDDNARMLSDLESAQFEIIRYVDLNMKLANDKITLQRKYLKDIEKINNEKFNKITLFSNPGSSNVIIHSGLRDIYQNISSSSNVSSPISNTKNQ